jgi:hypothetical protein
MLDEVFDRVHFLILIMSGRTASMSLKNSDSRSRIFFIRYLNMKSALIILAFKNVAFLIRLNSLI